MEMKTVYLKTFVLILVLNLTCPENHSQNLVNNQIIVPPSPSVASFQQFDFGQVNHYSGLPIINIPVYDLEIGAFKFPINLHYNYNGFKVENMAGWLGLGWDINAGGMISHIVRGKPDDDPVYGYFWVNEFLNVPDPINDAIGYIDFMSHLPNDTLRYFAEGLFDGMPDNYELRANNLSSSVIRLNSGDYVTIPYKKLDIAKTFSTPMSLDFWEVTDESGNKYRFGHLPGDQSQYGLENTSFEYSNTGSFDTDYQNYVSNWFLREIITNTNDTIHFNYTSETIARDSLIHVTSFRLLPNTLSCQAIPDLVGITTFFPTYTWKLSSIESRKCNIYFYSNTLRKDIHPGSSSCSLDSIKIEKFSGNTVKRLIFNYGYLGDTANFDRCRLILKKVTSLGDNGNADSISHIFNYDNSISVPSYTSKAQDFWGYYNGKTTNTSLIPSVIPNSPYNEYFVNCADRNPNHDYSKLGLLTSITLPTKGSISYIYEPNDYGYIRNQPIDSVLIPDSYQNDFVSVDGIPNSYATETKFFNIDAEQTVDISYLLSDNGYPHEEPSSVSIYPLVGEEYFSKEGFNSQGIEQVFLPAGNRHTVKAMAYGTGLHAQINVTSRTYKKDSQGNLLYDKNLISGGFRIKEIIQYDGLDYNNDKITTFKYYMPDEPDRSSGVLHHAPSYDFNTTLVTIKYLGAGFNPPVSDGECPYITRSSSSIQPTYGKDGYMGYAYISVQEGDSINNGSILYNYYTSIERPDKTFPKLTQPISKDYLRGRLKKMSVLNDTSGTLLTKEYIYNNPSSSPNRSGIWGMFLVEYSHNYIQDYLDTFDYPYFDVVTSEWSYLSETIETKYLSDGLVIDSIKYFYENPGHAQLTRTLEINSDGRSTEKKYYYPLDSPTNIQTSSLTRSQMIGRNMQFVLKSERSVAETVVDGQVVNYGENFLPSSLYELESGTYNPKNHFDNYDNYGNLLQMHKENDSNISYIWGYNQTYPVAKIEGIAYSHIWDSIKTNISERVYKSSSDSADVKEDVDYLKDQLSDYMLNANYMVTIYTYDPLIGMTSETDPNGKTTYYEYDSFGRLSAVRDNDHNLIKDYSYHMKEEFDEGVVGTYTITADKTGTGTISPSGSTEVSYGSDITYTFTPDSGCEISDVLVDGESVGAVTSYTFNDVISNHTISVIFECTNFLNLSTDYLYFSLSGGTTSVTITSNVSWIITESLSWISVSPTSGSNTSSVTVNCSMLTIGKRTGMITVSGGGITKTISVYQGPLLH